MYLGAASGFVGYDAVMRSVPIDEIGSDVEALAGLINEGTIPKLIYTIAEYQNPTGRTMSAARRRALIDICQQHQVLIVEDVAYRQLDSYANARPSLRSLAPEQVVQIGTFAKIISPGLRLGWAVGPAPVVAQLVVAKQNSDQCAGALGQRMVEQYLQLAARARTRLGRVGVGCTQAWCRVRTRRTVLHRRRRARLSAVIVQLFERISDRRRHLTTCPSH